jgi:hypothetical protein
MAINHQSYLCEMGEEHISDAPDRLVDALRKAGETVNLRNDYSISTLDHERALRKLDRAALWEAFFESCNGMAWNRFLALMEVCEHTFAVCKSDFQRANQHALFWFRHTRVEQERKFKRERNPEYYEMIESDKKGLDEFNPLAKFDTDVYEWGYERVDGMKSHRQQANTLRVQKWHKKQRT